MQTYELTYIISPEINLEEAEKKASAVVAEIQKLEGIILKQQNPVAKTLSYQIKKHASGFFGILEFRIEPENLLQVAEMVKKDAKISRHMLLIKKPVIIKKQRRAKKETPVLEELPSIEAKNAPVEDFGVAKKVDLQDIDKQLDELLGE